LDYRDCAYNITSGIKKPKARYKEEDLEENYFLLDLEGIKRSQQGKK